MKNCQNRCLDAGRRTFGGNCSCWSKRILLHGLKNDKTHLNVSKGTSSGKRHMMLYKHARSIIFVFGLMGTFFLLNSLIISIVHCLNLPNGLQPQRKVNILQVCFHIERSYLIRRMNNDSQFGFRPLQGYPLRFGILWEIGISLWKNDSHMSKNMFWHLFFLSFIQILLTNFWINWELFSDSWITFG